LLIIYYFLSTDKVSFKMLGESYVYYVIEIFLIVSLMQLRSLFYAAKANELDQDVKRTFMQISRSIDRLKIYGSNN
jgi:hypothetical protein